MEIPTNLSERLIQELTANDLMPKNCDKKKAQLIIRKYFCDIWRQAIEETNIAHNKKHYNDPQFEDK